MWIKMVDASEIKALVEGTNIRCLLLENNLFCQMVGLILKQVEQVFACYCVCLSVARTVFPLVFHVVDLVARLMFFVKTR